MNIPSINLEPNCLHTLKLTSIFSTFFVSLIIVAIVFTDDKEDVTLKSVSSTPVTTSEPALTTVTDVKSKDLTPSLIQSSDKSEIAKQSGTSSSVSNYFNAWKLSKVTPAFQIIV